MENLILEIGLKGKKGLALKTLSNFKFFFFDVKIVFKIFESFKNNISILILPKFFFNSNCLLLCRSEHFRRMILGCFFSKSLELTEIEIQLLRQIGKNGLNGIFQFEIVKNLNLKPNYVHHLLNKLIRLDLIEKSLNLLKINSKKSNAISLKLNLEYFVFKKDCFLTPMDRSNESKDFIFIKNIIKTLLRQKSVLSEKNLKYGTLYLENVPVKINKRKTHRSWQKIRQKCRKGSILTFDYEGGKRPKCTIGNIFSFSREKKKYSKSFYGLLRRKVKTCEIILLFFSHINLMVRKIIKCYGDVGVTSPMLLEKFRGQLSYKNIRIALHTFQRFRGFEKNLEQIGRQKILNFREKVIYTDSLEIFNLDDSSKLYNGVTNQVISRRYIVLNWVKFHFILLNDLGRKIALHEKKGLSKIDSKVIKRFLRDLINFDMLKVIKIHVQLSTQRTKRFEFIVKQNLDGDQIRKIFDFLKIPVYPTVKKETFYFSRKKNYPLTSNILIEGFIFQTRIFFFLSTLNVFYVFIGSKKKKYFNPQLFIKLALKVKICTNFKEKNVKLNRDFLKKTEYKKNLDFSKIFYRKNGHSKNLKICNVSMMLLLGYILLKKKNFFPSLESQCFHYSKKNWEEKKLEFDKKSKTNAFGLLDQKKKSNFCKIDTVNSGKYFQKKFHLIFKRRIKKKNKKIYFTEKYSKNYFVEKFLTKKKDFSLVSGKWDCEFDVKLYSIFLEILHDKYSVSELKVNLAKRRIKKLSTLVNVRLLTIFLQKLSRFRPSLFFFTFLKFSHFIKRSLEFPLSYFSFDIEKIKKNYKNKNQEKIRNNNSRDNEKFRIIKIKENIFSINLKSICQTIFSKKKIWNCNCKIYPSKRKNLYYCRRFFISLDKSSEIRKLQRYEVFHSFQFLRSIAQKMPKEKKNLNCFSQKFFTFLRLKEFLFFEKIDKNLTFLVPFFVKNFSHFTFLTSLIMEKKPLLKKKAPIISNLLEIRIFSSFVLYTSTEVFFNISKIGKIKKLYTKTKETAKVIKPINSFFKKIGSILIYDQISLINGTIQFFLKIKLKNFNDYFFFWKSFIKIISSIKTQFKMKFICTRKIFQTKQKRLNLKFFQKIKYFVLFNIIESPILEIEQNSHFMKSIPLILPCVESLIFLLNTEKRIKNLKICGRMNFFSTYFTSISFQSRIFIFKKICKNLVIFPRLMIPLF